MRGRFCAVASLLLLLLAGSTCGVRTGSGEQQRQAGAGSLKVRDDGGLDSILEVMQSLLKSVESDEADSGKALEKKTSQWEETLKTKEKSVKGAKNELSVLTEDVGELQTEAADYASQVQMTKQSVTAMDGEIDDTQSTLDKHRAKCIRERTGTQSSMMQIQDALVQEKQEERNEKRNLKQLRRLNKRLRKQRSAVAAQQQSGRSGLGSDQATLLELQNEDPSSAAQDQELGAVGALMGQAGAMMMPSFLQVGVETSSTSDATALTRRTVTKENALKAEYKRLESILPEEQSECKKEEEKLQNLIVEKKSSLRQTNRQLESFTKLNAETQAKLSATQLDIKDKERIIKRDEDVISVVKQEKDAYVESSKGVTAARTDVITTLNEVIDGIGSYLHPNGIAAISEFSKLSTATMPLSFLQFGATDAESAGLDGGMVQGSALQEFLAGGAQAQMAQGLRQQMGAAVGVRTMIATDAQQMVQAQQAQAAAEDPFASVKEMIHNLIDAAKQKANEEMGHEDWCNQEKEKNKNAKTSKKDAIDMLAAEIRTNTGAIADLEQQITFSTAENQRLGEEIAKMKATHAADMEAMSTTIGDYDLAVQAVDQAYGLLEAAFGVPPAALLEGANKAATRTPDKILTKVKELKGKFLALKQRLSTAKEEGDVLHGKVVKDSEDAQRAWKKSLQDANSEKSTKEELLLTAKSDKKGGETELQAINDYLENLEVECGPQMVDYDAAKKRREDEIEALKDAYKVLMGETIPSFDGAAAASAFLQVSASVKPTQQAPIAQMLSALRSAQSSSQAWESQVLETQGMH